MEKTRNGGGVIRYSCSASHVKPFFLIFYRLNNFPPKWNVPLTRNHWQCHNGTRTHAQVCSHTCTHTHISKHRHSLIHSHTLTEPYFLLVVYLIFSPFPPSVGLSFTIFFQMSIPGAPFYLPLSLSLSVSLTLSVLSCISASPHTDEWDQLVYYVPSFATFLCSF